MQPARAGHAAAGDEGRGFLRAKLLPQIEEGCEREELIDDVCRHRFEFCGEAHELGANIDWLRNPSDDLEWQILLHKFYYAVGLAERYRITQEWRYVETFRDLIESWIEQTPPNFIATDVTARRVQNWIYAWYLFEQAGVVLSPEFHATLRRAIETQIACILAQLAPERNHRTLELYAVFVAALALRDSDQAAGWLDFATTEMVANIRTDLLDDGVQCELSTDYHHIVLRSYLLFYRLAKLNGLALPADIAPRLSLALDFAMHIHRPDGDIPALSDSDTRSYRYLLQWGADAFEREDYRYVATAGRAGRPPLVTDAIFSDSGYCVQRSAWDEKPFANARYLVLDAGPIGQGNHGHLDALSIEVAAYGRPLIVDPGRYTYFEGGSLNWRAAFRGTAAHNTVTVDDRDQAIYQRRLPGGRRKVLRPHPKTSLIAAERSGPISYLCGQTASPNYGARHRRHVVFASDRYWLIVDELDDVSAHDYCLNFQLTPEAAQRARVLPFGEHACVDGPNLRMIAIDGAQQTTIGRGFVARAYGAKEPAPKVCVRRRASRTSFATFLLPYRDVPPLVRMLADGVLQLDLEGITHEWRFDRDIRSVVWQNGSEQRVLRFDGCSRHV